MIGQEYAYTMIRMHLVLLVIPSYVVKIGIGHYYWFIKQINTA